MTFPPPDYIKTFLNNKLSRNNSDEKILIEDDDLQRSTLEEVTVYRDNHDNIEGFEVRKKSGKNHSEKVNGHHRNMSGDGSQGANSKTHLTLTSAGKHSYGTSGREEEIEIYHNDNLSKFRKAKSLVKSKATEYDDTSLHTHGHIHNDDHHHISSESPETGSSSCTSEEHVHHSHSHDSFQESSHCEDDSEHCHDDSDVKEQTENRKRKKALKKLVIATILSFLFMCGEILGGYLANSLAIMTDASHLLTDVSSFLVSIIALQLAAKPSSKRMTFGWHRAEVIGAITSVLAIWVLTGILVYLAAKRLISGDYELNGKTMLITASCAVAFNILMGLVLHESGHGHSHHGHSHGHSHGDSENHSHGDHDHSEEKTGNVNVRAAFIHVIGDLLQSLGVLTAAFIIYFKPEYKIADPICTFLFSVLVLATTITILRDTIVILMEGTPASINYEKVKNELLATEGVIAVHDLRIWSLTLNQCVMSCHLAVAQNAKPGTILKLATKSMKARYNFHSMTIQVEAYSMDMDDCRKCQAKNK